MIKILIVDDSPTEAALIHHVINSDKEMMVIAVAKNGEEAIELTARLKPDLITMDIQMPIMDGLEATRIIMSQNPTPIVVISSLVNNESINATFPILESGALGVLAKPEDIFSPSFEERRKYILDTLRSLAQIRVIKKAINTSSPYKEKKPLSFCEKNNSSYELIAIGASVGGPKALKIILSQLTADFPLPIVITQHMTGEFINGFAQWLAQNISLKVKIAEENDLLEKGTVYIAPEKKHLEIKRIGEQLMCQLVKGNSVSGFCPSITQLLLSVARVSGKKAIGILLTGMGDDGAIGLLELKKAQGHTLIQDKESSIVFGMAAIAQSLGAVDKVVELDNMARYLMQISTAQIE